ncbi:hypothetical protein [Shimazuella kribbensis]|uniref:hypothetical protein n=1 Tax=Shimazuella kribbensis TaxID=139808 RepID=UPI0012EB7FAD|nr:hypothetical protein [Shimazuella kribbensis]
MNFIRGWAKIAKSISVCFPFIGQITIRRSDAGSGPKSDFSSRTLESVPYPCFLIIKMSK